MIYIKIYSEKDFHLFDNFVNNSINGTIFHEQRFISYHGKNKFQDSSLLIYENEKLIAVFPAALIIKNNTTILKSHPGTSYGGLVINENLPFEKISNIYNSIESFCLKNNINQKKHMKRH